MKMTDKLASFRSPLSFHYSIMNHHEDRFGSKSLFERDDDLPFWLKIGPIHWFAKYNDRHVYTQVTFRGKTRYMNVA